MKFIWNTIMLVYLILNTNIFLIYLSLIRNPLFTSNDCYEAFSSPKQFFILSHYNPTGPIFLNIVFSYKLYSYIFGFKVKNYNFTYYLKRIDGNCPSSFALSTIGKDFKKMEISIVMSLYTKWQKISSIEYIFYKGFSSGHFNLIDKPMNFGLSLQILDVNDDPLSNIKFSWKDAKSYLHSLSNKNIELCVVTENNLVVLLKPDYLSSKPKGLVTGLHTQLEENGKIISYFSFPAFECDKNKTYIDKKTVFIVNKYEITVKFFALYNKEFNRLLEYNRARFNIANVEFKDLSNSDLFTGDENKVFLFPKTEYVLDCEDGTKRHVRKTQNGTIYYAKESLENEAFHGVKQKINIPKSPISPCNE